MIHYLLQDEAKKELNLYPFTAMESDILTVSDIRKSFPVEGNFHFRFRTTVQDNKGSATVWLDIADDTAPVPTYQGQIFIKALQLPPFSNQSLTKPTRKTYKTSNGVSKPMAKPQAKPQPKPHHPASEPGEFIEFEKPKASERSHSAKPKQDPVMELNTEELRKKREEKVEATAKQKSEDTKERWRKHQKLIEDKKEAHRVYGPNIDKWETQNWQKNNLITLLSTLHNVIWEGSGWKPIGPGDLISSKNVKMNYLKSIQIIHPDKHQNDPPHIQYISERLFGAVSEAWKNYQGNQ
mgnify:CR=1 FL=1